MDEFVIEGTITGRFSTRPGYDEDEDEKRRLMWDYLEDQDAIARDLYEE